MARRSYILLLGGLVAGATLSAQSTFSLTQPDGIRDLSGVLNQTRIVLGGTYLGVALGDIDADRARALKLNEERGVEVREVSPASPAEAAGLKPGDVLLTYNGENILGAQQLSRLVNETPVGRKVRIQYLRDGKEQSATVTVSSRPPMHLEVNPRFQEENAQRLRDMQTGFRDIERMMADQPMPIFGWKSSIGIFGETVEGQLAQYFGVKQGVLVRSVENGSAAERAGVHAGDVITGVGDHSVSSAREITSWLRNGHGNGNGSNMTLVRNHKDLTLKLPADPQ